MIVNRMELFGARLDGRANSAGETRLSSKASKILIECRPAEEEWAIVRQVPAALLGPAGGSLEDGGSARARKKRA